ncbi:hypothetical protein DYH09_33750 [bacterium CPR1]|nr:hypothetical protein [bacterium CPR1]
MRTIRFETAGSDQVQEVSVSELPAEQQAVYRKGGKAVDPCEDADEVVPIVRVLMIPRDASGQVVTKEEASEIVIQEFGEGRHPLRETILLRN